MTQEGFLSDPRPFDLQAHGACEASHHEVDHDRDIVLTLRVLPSTSVWVIEQWSGSRGLHKEYADAAGVDTGSRVTVLLTCNMSWPSQSFFADGARNSGLFSPSEVGAKSFRTLYHFNLRKFET